MSNNLAIATVTATLTQVLQNAINLELAGAAVKPVRPDQFKNGTPPRGVSVFLYQVTPNAQWRNEDLGLRRTDGSLRQVPTAAVDLHYLISFFGDETQLEPQRMMGSVVSSLHSHPTLTRERIRAAITAALAGDPNHFLGRSNFADQIDLVRFTPHPLSLEELSRLWSVFFQFPYSLSVLYEASVVLLEASETPAPAPPVKSRAIFAVPLGIPRIEQIVPQIAPFSATARITLKGVNLFRPGVVVRFGELVSTPDTPLLDAELGVPLPAGLPAGVRTAQVIHSHDLGTTVEPHRAFESNPVPFILQPAIQNISFSAPNVSVQVAPEVGPRQDVSLILNEQAPGTRAFGFKLGDRTSGLTNLAFSVTGVPSATYLARLRVDGAESNLGPTVVIP